MAIGTDIGKDIGKWAVSGSVLHRDVGLMDMHTHNPYYITVLHRDVRLSDAVLLDSRFPSKLRLRLQLGGRDQFF